MFFTCSCEDLFALCKGLSNLSSLGLLEQRLLGEDQRVSLYSLKTTHFVLLFSLLLMLIILLRIPTVI